MQFIALVTFYFDKTVLYKQNYFLRGKTYNIAQAYIM